MTKKIVRLLVLIASLGVGLSAVAQTQLPLAPMSLAETLTWLHNFSIRHGQWVRQARERVEVEAGQAKITPTQEQVVIRTNIFSEVRGCSVTVSEDFFNKSKDERPSTATWFFSLREIDPDYIRVSTDTMDRYSVDFEIADGSFRIEERRTLGNGKTETIRGKQEHLLFDSEETATSFAARFTQAVQKCQQSAPK